MIERYKTYSIDRVSGITSLDEALALYTTQQLEYVTDTENHWTFRQAIDDYVRTFDDAIAVLDAVWHQREAFPSRHTQRQAALRCVIGHATTLEDWVRVYTHFSYYRDPEILPTADARVLVVLQATTDWDRLWNFYLAVPDNNVARAQAWLRVQETTATFGQALAIWRHDQPPASGVGGWAWNKMGLLVKDMKTFCELLAALDIFSDGQPDKNLPAILEQMSIKASTLTELLFTYERVRTDRQDIVDRVVTRLREYILRIDSFDAAVAARRQVESVESRYPFDTVRHVAMARCVELAPDYSALRQSYSLTLSSDRTTKLYRERLIALSGSVLQVIAAFDDYVHTTSIHNGRLAAKPYIGRIIELAQTPDDWALLIGHYLLYQYCSQEIRDLVNQRFDATLTAAGYPPAEVPAPPAG